jgi:hypothetical protein
MKLNPLLKREAHLNLSVEKSSPVNELVYIQSNDSIIEKQIGKKEDNHIQVLISSIVGFSEGIKFRPSSVNKFVTVYG